VPVQDGDVQRKPGRGRLRWLAVPVLLAVVAALAWLLFPRDRTEPQPLHEGEYLYATRGFEEVDVLGGARHTYPAETGIRVRQQGRGCRRLVWRPLRNRITTWVLCGEHLVAIHEVHDFFGNRDERTYRCGPGSSLRRGWSCSFGDTTEVATGGVVGRARIAGARTDHVRLERRITGGVQGEGTRSFWLRLGDSFPVRLTGTTDDVSPSPIGDVRYRERYMLELDTPPGG
jgi:hypothetical protein